MYIGIYVLTLLRYIDRYIDLIDRFCAVQCSAVEREELGGKVCQDQSGWAGIKREREKNGKKGTVTHSLTRERDMIAFNVLCI